MIKTRITEMFGIEVSVMPIDQACGMKYITKLKIAW